MGSMHTKNIPKIESKTKERTLVLQRLSTTSTTTSSLKITGSDDTDEKQAIDIVFNPANLMASNTVPLKEGESIFMETISSKSNPHEFT